MVPIQGIGVEAAKPVLLQGPEARLTCNDLDVCLRRGEETVWDSLPGGAAGDLLKSQILIKLNRCGVVIANVEPDGGGVFGTRLVHAAFRESPSDAAPTVVGM